VLNCHCKSGENFVVRKNDCLQTSLPTEMPASKTCGYQEQLLTRTLTTVKVL
jgi:hypothetical protein